MALSTDEPREAARATPMVLRSRAARNITAPAIPSPLRQVRAVGVASPLAQVNGGQDSTTTNNAAQPVAKRPRTEEFLGDRNAGNDSGADAPVADCSKQAANVLCEERRLYEAKMKLFQDCAAAVDNTLNKAGTDLYPYAKEFSAFFAECLQSWLKGSNPYEARPKTATSQGNKTYAKVAGSTKAASPETSLSAPRTSRVSVQGAPARKDTDMDLRVFICMDKIPLWSPMV